MRSNKEAAAELTREEGAILSGKEEEKEKGPLERIYRKRRKKKKNIYLNKLSKKDCYQKRKTTPFFLFRSDIFQQWERKSQFN